ncbi:substrate-binding domain-containing protein [Microbacterium esteraromaticum]|uniref:substrate-binding domain-containing protein n=1 Tax=Microbacterium esteraromaticum TaxID=57043 RepID=UPI001C9888FF|nr:substrate-binding domain-containing protein [Microbacterium esteraromaticum]MBY6060158.1 substrate-binding domain-containing protein [Microbacterium esteraromaticum]
MRAAERRSAIERELNLTGRVDVAVLARQLSVSPISIRRDLNDLVEKGIARRVHGGAIAARMPSASGPQIVRRPPPARSEGGIIGLVVPSSHYYYAGVLEGVKAAAVEARVRVALLVSGYSQEQELAQIKRLVDRGVTSLIATPAVIPERDPRTYEALREVGSPVVLLERDGGDDFAMLDSVRSDHEFGARLAFQQLADDGHRSVALVSAERTPTAGWLRAGFEAKRGLFDGATERMAIPSAPEYAPELQESLDTVLDRFAQLGTTGALVHSDLAAVALAQRARERRMDVTVIAYDDEIAALADPPMDAVAPRKHEVGRLALMTALERAGQSADDVVPRHVTVPPAFALRRALEA